MGEAALPGRIVILNGAPRSGKSSIARALQAADARDWTNLGVDALMAATPEALRPGIGLRPGGERPDLEPVVETLYLALYEGVAALSRRGLDVVVDVGHHDSYSSPLRILPRCAGLLHGLPAMIVGVRCPPPVAVERRRATWGESAADEGRARTWEEAVHTPGIYDLELDTSILSPAACAAAILARLEEPPRPDALERLARL